MSKEATQLHYNFQWRFLSRLNFFLMHGKRCDQNASNFQGKRWWVNNNKHCKVNEVEPIIDITYYTRVQILAWMQIALGMLYGPPSYATLRGHDVAKPIVKPD